jgi:hypothetical protein
MSDANREDPGFLWRVFVKQNLAESDTLCFRNTPCDNPINAQSNRAEVELAPMA